jgi:hypothetical protein
MADVTGVDSSPAADATPSPRDRLDAAKWHIDRYDRLRASTSSRAAVVLSAGAILTAGNAVILSQLLQNAALVLWLVALCTAGLLASAGLIVLAIVRATGVLVSLRLTREMFPDPDPPIGLVFNATDTVRHAPLFEQFDQAVRAQDLNAILGAAHVELWIIIRQHRHRYGKLRGSVKALRLSATIFLSVLAVLVIANLATRL